MLEFDSGRNFGIYYYRLVDRVCCAGIYVRVARTIVCSCGPRCTFLSPWQLERTETTSMKQSGTVSSILYLHLHSLTRQKDSSQKSVQKLKRDISDISVLFVTDVRTHSLFCFMKFRCLFLKLLLGIGHASGTARQCIA
jgi:hypothetical protein